MILKIFSVYDSATEAYLQPFYARTSGEAIRSFTSAANTEDHNFHKHADDYVLFEIGEFNDASGVIAPCTPKSLGVASEYVSYQGTRIRSEENNKS